MGSLYSVDRLATEYCNVRGSNGRKAQAFYEQMTANRKA